MCHIPYSNIFEKAENGLVVYKVAVERDLVPFRFKSNIDLIPTGDILSPISPYIFEKRNDKEYYSPFAEAEIKIGTLMVDNNYFIYDADSDDEISYGYFHFFETIEDARRFLNWHFRQCNFNADSRPCILVGTIPEGEYYNRGIFPLNGDEFKSIIAKAVIYSGEIYYE